MAQTQTFPLLLMEALRYHGSLYRRHEMCPRTKKENIFARRSEEVKGKTHIEKLSFFLFFFAPLSEFSFFSCENASDYFSFLRKLILFRLGISATSQTSLAFPFPIPL